MNEQIEHLKLGDLVNFKSPMFPEAKYQIIRIVESTPGGQKWYRIQDFKLGLSGFCLADALEKTE